MKLLLFGATLILFVFRTFARETDEGKYFLSFNSLLLRIISSFEDNKPVQKFLSSFSIESDLLCFISFILRIKLFIRSFEKNNETWHYKINETVIGRPHTEFNCSL